MTMKVNVYVESLLALFLQTFRILDKMKGLRKCIFSCLVERPIQILTKKTSSIVSCYDSIRVQHWNNIKMISSQNHLSIILYQAFYQALANMRGVRFPWMYSRRNKNHFFIVTWLRKICYLENGNRQPTQCSPACFVFYTL